ncbi:hypothetical protein ACWGJ2_12460 [Streptomyces sp. NPDC054796]
MSGEREAVGDQSRLVLTPHPLQRVGAHALAALVRAEGPAALEGAGFVAAVEQVIADAQLAAVVRDSKAANGFWLKASHSLFPNSAMNHPRNAQLADDVLRQGVRAWLERPDPSSWPRVPCALCGREAVGFFGKRDVPLAESASYVNSTPRGHAGMALCFPCLSSFHALPYGCVLTGGSSIAVHSWDEALLSLTVARQVERNRRIAASGVAPERRPAAREVVALDALRAHPRRLVAGVELLVFSNNNKSQQLERYGLEEPLAEWLRSTIRGRDRRGFGALVRAHVRPGTPGVVGLARSAFRNPQSVLSAGQRYLLGRMTGPAPDPDEAGALVGLLNSYTTKVVRMHENDLAELRGVARRIAVILHQETTPGKLRMLRNHLKGSSKPLRNWLTAEAVTWALTPPEGHTGPLLSERAHVLLFDPGADNPAWLHRDLLLIHVLEELNRLGWKPRRKPGETDEGEDEVAEDRDALDENYISNTETDEDEQ